MNLLIMLCRRNSKTLKFIFCCCRKESLIFIQQISFEINPISAAATSNQACSNKPYKIGLHFGKFGTKQLPFFLPKAKSLYIWSFPWKLRCIAICRKMKLSKGNFQRLNWVQLYKLSGQQQVLGIEPGPLLLVSGCVCTVLVHHNS